MKLISTFLQKHTTENKINILMDLAKKQNYLKINSPESVKKYQKKNIWNVATLIIIVCLSARNTGVSNSI